jgi:ERCC4-related helicase
MGDKGQKIIDTFNSGQDRVLVATTAAGSGWDTNVELVILWEGAFDTITAT